MAYRNELTHDDISRGQDRVTAKVEASESLNAHSAVTHLKFSIFRDSMFLNMHLLVIVLYVSIDVACFA